MYNVISQQINVRLSYGSGCDPKLPHLVPQDQTNTVKIATLRAKILPSIELHVMYWPSIMNAKACVRIIGNMFPLNKLFE